ncbi:DUF2813 domain-containing protein [Caviibacterium pharyngocola]|uniref:ATP-dependent endonuclease n=1 Tax=Caviibacterium pharyngocola TaxID=28159 RepID=A0A2M8RUY3_9PAST|nr:DUF2813 domain-containing protein [Caviibacterium pharyngocola]PJG82684.1 ATP-dependent endonuclease [Caviibacterium pharyngocola]
MYLRQLDIMGFRGINRLSLTLRPNMVLIGENAWGKSSLLAALSLILNAEKKLYQFTAEDFYLATENDPQPNEIRMLFTFCEQDATEHSAQHNHPYRHLFVPNEDGYSRVYFQVTGSVKGERIVTDYAFLDKDGKIIPLENNDETALSLIGRHPVYRFRDARLNPRKVLEIGTSRPNGESQDDLQKEIQAVRQLLQYYFLNRQSAVELTEDTTLLWHRAKSLCLKLRQDENHLLQKRLFRDLSALFLSSEQLLLNKYTRPIILLEDPEARLHPRMVAIAWELSNYFPMQRITTTNSVELISQVGLLSICRLVRAVDRTKSFQLTRKDLGKEDLRRLTFHIHHNRSLALFSRVWLLVEGETEVWILNELAKLLHIDLAMEGIRIVEFAQCGLRPLIKYVKAMGIEWYVLTDGDEAGRKYAEVVKNLQHPDDPAGNRITILPKRDIEHFFYHAGFESVFIRLARWQVQSNVYPVSKIIQKAIQRTSKPDLAISLSTEIEKRGVQSIPLLFKRLFSRVLTLARD